MILKAESVKARKLPRPLTPVARHGLSYQRKFTQSFRDSAPEGIEISADPWYTYLDTQIGRELTCVPDLVAFDRENNFNIVIEVKTTYTPLALEKLQKIYCPVVSRASGFPARPLVVCRTLSPGAPRPQPTISFALLSAEPLFHWRGREPIRW